MDDIKITKMDVKGSNFFFWSGTAKYQIPSKMFPIARKGMLNMFNYSNTEEFADQGLIEIIDSLDFPEGECYSKSQKVYEKAKDKGYDVTYFSGWLFIGDEMPIHHSWVVYRHDGKLSIIDTAKNKMLLMIQDEHREELNNSKDWRADFARLIKRYDMRHKTHEKILMGRTAEDFLYIGSPDDMEHAKYLFRQVTNNYPEHPTYMKKGLNAFGRSKLQEELERIRR
jgi:hypothetical protein